ncbi:MAG TPA: YcaO-related McrA-glycine thioamidation protein [Methanothrix sp.]|nr:YcaO-related McrA-glycine thioamidation protein [Methanothrix sp.]HPJ83230.1 YcaO-related McrA-glycine thioamidation protein [Methanothrix sp.]
MLLRSCIKKYKTDTHRAFSPEETLDRIAPKMELAGITRVADITNLDRIGIPVFSSIRPAADKGAISVYNGKGATPAEARVSAMMEGIERYSAEAHERELLVETFSKIKSETNALDPRDLILPQDANPEMPIPWVEGYDLIRKEEVMVPASGVFHPLPPNYPQLFRTNTNGLASGNVIEEAVFHGLSEVIERDAWSLVEAVKRTGPLVTEVENGLASGLIEKFAAAEVEVRIKDITSDVGVPTIAAASDDVRLKDPALLTIGMGTHTSAEVAVLRALTEVAQSRLTQIHGAREDTTTADFRRQIGYDRTKRLNKHWFADSETRSFSEIRSQDSEDFLDDINLMMKRLEEAGMDRAIVVDLTREEIGVPVVRVMVPGLEQSAMDPDRRGKRCRDEIKRYRRLSRAGPR